jgi:NADH-quinone oxidoreductase subunit N
MRSSDMILLPEFSILSFAVIFLFLSLGCGRSRLILAAKLLSIAVFGLTLASIHQAGALFSDAYRVDFFTQFFKALIAGGFTLVILMLDRKEEIRENWLAEFIMFLGFSSLGLMMMVSANELISLVIALEISSYSLYVAVPLRAGQGLRSLEASMKYIFFGAISTGVMLFGMSYMYGLTHSTNLVEIASRLPASLSQPMGILGRSLTLAGFFFKLSVFPLHFWSPDVYEGASGITTTFISTIPKIAATAVMIKLTIPATSGNFPLVLILMIISAISMTMGNLVGLTQHDLKRLLAFSGIAHAGYLLLGILALSSDGYSAAIFYITVYLFANIGAFYVIVLIAKQTENAVIEDLSGLVKRAPLLAITLAVAVFSLAGIPPTGGFTGKLFLLTGALKDGHLAIVIVAVVNTAISIYYYLNLVRMSFSRDPLHPVEPMRLTIQQKLVCLIFIAAILYLGVHPYGLLGLFESAV